MKKLRKNLYLFIIISVLSGCAAMGGKNTIENDCVPNFIVEGSFWTGKTYRSSKVFPEAKKYEAFDNIVSTLAASGWQIINSNKEQGLISASAGVIMGQGKTVPLNVIIRQNSKKEIKIDLTFAITGGLSTSTDAVVKEFCEIYKSVD